ncbi:MAG: hypothetical protein JWP74_1520 [Marmoricola sp.]|nr:hypothetical protein [Marmoricola sp.]
MLATAHRVAESSAVGSDLTGHVTGGAVGHCVHLGSPVGNADGIYQIDLVCDCGWRSQEEGASPELAYDRANEWADNHVKDPRTTRDSELRTIFWVSVLLGVLGLVPAAVYANAATRDGRSSSAYWDQFFKGLFLATILWFVIYEVLSSH